MDKKQPPAKGPRPSTPKPSAPRPMAPKPMAPRPSAPKAPQPRPVKPGPAKAPQPMPVKPGPAKAPRPAPVKPGLAKAPRPAVVKPGPAKVPPPAPPRAVQPKVPPVAPVAGTAKERGALKAARREQRRSYMGGLAAVGAVTAGTGIAAGAMAESQDALQQRLQYASDQLSSLQQAASLADIYGDLEDTDSTLVNLPGEVEAIRTRGYVFAGYLENKAQVLAQQWANTREQVIQAIEQRSADLMTDVNEAERALQMAYSGNATQIARAESAIQQLGSKVSAAQDAIERMYDTIDDNVTQLMAQLEKIDWVLDQATEASFSFYEGEDLVAACEAMLLEQGDEGPKGILHLTNERLAFERKEEVATKKILFITTEKELVHEFVFEAAVGHAEEVKASEKGFLGSKELLEINFAPEADISQARFQLLSADSEEWAQLIQRVKSGEIERERVAAAAGEQDQAAPTEQPAAVEVSEIPTKCPNCGALLTQPVVRGMREITCEYCFTVIRL